MSWPTNDPYGAQPPSGRPADQPPWTSTSVPIPPYVPPQPGQWGPQDRPYAASPPPPPQVRYADWAERVGATLVDGLIIFAGLMAVGAVGAVSEPLGGLVGLAWFVLIGYVAWLNGSKGQSPGKALLGLKVVRDVDGTTLGGPVGLIRAFVLWLMGGFTGGLLFVLAVLWPLWDQKNQALHDKLFGATVVAGYPRAKGTDIFRP